MKTRNGLFADIPEELWNDWKWQVRNRIETVEGLKKYLEITEKEEEGIRRCLGVLRMAEACHKQTQYEYQVRLHGAKVL